MKQILWRNKLMHKVCMYTQLNRSQFGDVLVHTEPSVFVKMGQMAHFDCSDSEHDLKWFLPPREKKKISKQVPLTEIKK